MSIRKGKYIQKHYELTVEVSSKLSSNLVIRAPILLLGWSPLLGKIDTLALQVSSPPRSADYDLELEDVALQSPPTSPAFVHLPVASAAATVPTSYSPVTDSGHPPSANESLTTILAASTVAYGSNVPVLTENTRSNEPWFPSSPSSAILSHRDPGAKLLEDSPITSDEDDIILH